MTEWMSCPQYGRRQQDLDGFGFLYCRKCGYCKHASISGSTCDFCKKQVPPSAEVRS